MEPARYSSDSTKYSATGAMTRSAPSATRSGSVIGEASSDTLVDAIENTNSCTVGHASQPTIVITASATDAATTYTKVSGRDASRMASCRAHISARHHT